MPKTVVIVVLLIVAQNEVQCNTSVLEKTEYVISTCSSTRKSLCAVYDCKQCYERSFASHPKSQHWSIQNKVQPRQITKGSKVKYWFTCNLCKHDFDATLNNISSNNSWCPYHTLKLCADTDCLHCYNRSFASHEKSKHWSTKNKIQPRDVARSSSSGKYWFHCSLCGHDFECGLGKITCDSRWCPYCADPPQKLCDEKDCQTCYNKSFASHERSAFWSTTNKITSRKVFKFSNKKYCFTCEANHSFTSVLYSVTAGTWCPVCKHKTEQIVYEWLGTFTTVTSQKSFNWCINPATNRKAKFDFVLESYKTIIEVDGPQHFVQISNWQDPELTVKTDITKMNAAIRNGYTVIRISQNDILHNKIDWKLSLRVVLESPDSDPIVYIARNPKLYDNHKVLLCL